MEELKRNRERLDALETRSNVEYRYTIFAPLSFQVAIRDCNSEDRGTEVERRKVGLYLYFRPIFYASQLSLPKSHSYTTSYTI